MAGAAVLCAKGAYRSGAGLVTVSVPEPLFPIIQTTVPEAVCQDRKRTLQGIQAFDVIIFGPGIGREKSEGQLLEAIFKQSNKKILLDADGLNLLSSQDKLKWMTQTRAQTIITPHPGEAKRILGLAPEDRILPEDRRDAARKLHEITGGVVVLKGHQTIVYDGRLFWVNETGNPGMATAGSGDVLSGIIGSLWGQGYDAGEAARLGTYIHGLAGDLAMEQLGQEGLMAGDLCLYTGLAIKKIMEEQQ